MSVGVIGAGLPPRSQSVIASAHYLHTRPPHFITSARYPWHAVATKSRPMTERRAATRRRLLDAAIAVVAERGFHAASVDAIAEEAGYSVGAIYSNFGGKDDLFLAVFDEHASWFESVLSDPTTEPSAI